jgi:hypothetical protein
VRLVALASRTLKVGEDLADVVPSFFQSFVREGRIATLVRFGSVFR